VDYYNLFSRVKTKINSINLRVIHNNILEEYFFQKSNIERNTIYNLLSHTIVEQNYPKKKKISRT